MVMLLVLLVSMANIHNCRVALFLCRLVTQVQVTQKDMLADVGEDMLADVGEDMLESAEPTTPPPRLQSIACLIKIY